MERFIATFTDKETHMPKLEISLKAKALIFDIDGTLLDTMPTHYEASNKACQKYGFEFPYDFFLAKAGIPTPTVFKMLGEELGITHVDMVKVGEEKEAIYKQLATTIKPLEYVARLARENYGKMPLSCGTGADREIADININGSGMRDLFECIITCEDVANPKPAPDTFLKCAEIMGVEPEFCQVFEDGNPGLEAARTAGMIATDIRLFN